MDQDAGGRGEGRPATAWVFASPHSGAAVPADMRAAPGLSRRSLRSAEDALVDRLIGSGAARGAALLLGGVSRAYVDLNRGPEELDPHLIEGLEPGRPVSPRAAAGYGVIPRLSGDGRPLNGARLTRAEAEARVAAWHAPYHARLTALMEAAKEAHGRAILVDWHSMPASREAGAPQVVIGDRHGEACAPELTRRLKGLFEAEGWRVALNAPYARGVVDAAVGSAGRGVRGGADRAGPGVVPGPGHPAARSGLGPMQGRGGARDRRPAARMKKGPRPGARPEKSIGRKRPGRA